MKFVVDDNWPVLAVGQFGQRPRLCLPTGKTPIPFYDTLPANALNQTTVFLLDEFGLAAGSPARCDVMLRSALLDRVPARRFERPMTEADDLESECARYHDLVSVEGLDLAVLGLGRNGHLGLNEPGSTPDATTRVVELAEETSEGARSYGADPPPTWGIALGLAEILESKEIWLLVSGEAKAKVLEAAVLGPTTSKLPASFLQTHANVTVFADRAAAAALSV